MYNGNFDIIRMLDQSNLSTQRCRLIFWVECSVGGYLDLAKTYMFGAKMVLSALAQQLHQHIKLHFCS
jgi:hypothetical protein